MLSRFETGQLLSVIGGAAIGAAGHPIMAGIIVVSFLDLATGLVKAWSLAEISSNRLGRGLYKILAYLAVGIGLVLIGKVSGESLIAANALAAAFLFRELLSVVENLHVIGSALKVDIPAVSLLVRILRLNEAKLLAEAGERGQSDD